MKVRKTADKTVMVNGAGLGGTTTLSAGNAVRADGGLKLLGIDLSEEFEELNRDIPITYDHRDKWQKASNRLYEICNEMELAPRQLPKLGDYSRCTGCGRCVLGCQHGVKWDSRQFIKDAGNNGADVITGCKAVKAVTEKGRVTGVQAKMGTRNVFFPADVVVLAAGGFSTPVILKNSGIVCENRLFVDPVLCVAAECKDSFQDRELSMPFVVQREHYILSPYFDYLSFFFNRKWRYHPSDTLIMMIKLADACEGSVDGNQINKTLTVADRDRLRDGIEICSEILVRYGIKKDDIFLGTVNAGHPGGMLPLTEESADSFHDPRLPENLYVADATLFPGSLGNPPILTIMAMAKRVGKLIGERFI
jgi:choline dehydrogenase-like flavoprotein